MKLLRIVLPLLLAPALVVTNAEPLFLFSGQSNMEGHASSRYSVGRNADLRDYVFQEFLADPNEETLETRLNEAYAVQHSIREPDVVQHQIQQLMELYDQGIVNANIALNHSSAKCFFNKDPSNITRDTATPVSPYVNCGMSYGHELMFSHTLPSQNPAWENTPFTVAKVAHGATEIYKHWYPGSGMYWDDLNRTIHATPGEWHGFAWHQGEHDCFTWKHDGRSDWDDTSYSYLGNLTALIAAVRTELYRANANANANTNSGRMFATPSDIPVAIFSIHWPEGERLDRIVKAQRAFVEHDEHAVLIEFEDLGQFYHLDPVGLLITGNRLATAWSTILPDPDPAHADDTDDMVETIVMAATAAIVLVTLIVLVRSWICRIRRQETMAEVVCSEEITRGLMVPQTDSGDGTNGSNIHDGGKKNHRHPYQDEPLPSPAGRRPIA